MPEVRYEVPGVPPRAAYGLSAFLPHLTRAAGSGYQTYKPGIHGSPGTVPIPAPAPALPDAGAVGLGMAGQSTSSMSPDMWWPQQYYSDGIYNRPGAGMPIQVYDPTTPAYTTVLPVPAGNPAPTLRKESATLARRALLQRIRQLPWYPRLYKAPSA